MAAEILSGDHFRRMEVAGVQAQRSLAAGGVPHVELVGADGIALGADAEQLALNGVDMVRRVQLLPITSSSASSRR